MKPRMEVNLKVTKREQQAALVLECRASGMTAKAWCESKGIEYHRYLTWATKLNREGQHEQQQWADVTMVKKKNVPLAKSDLNSENGQFVWKQGLVHHCLRIYLGSWIPYAEGHREL